MAKANSNQAAGAAPVAAAEVTAAEADVAELMQQLPAHAVCVVERIELTGRKSVGRVDVAAFGGDPDGFIARKFGPGKYRLRFMGPDASGRIGFLKQSSVDVADDHEAAVEWRKRNAAPEAERADAPLGGRLAEVLAIANALRGNDRPPPADNTALIVAMMDNQSKVFTALITAMMGRPTTDPLAIAKEIAAAVKSDRPQGGLAEAIDMMSKMNTLRDQLAPPPPEPEGVGGRILSSLAPVFARAVDGAMRASAAAPAAGVSAAPAPAALTAGEPEDTMEVRLRWLAAKWLAAAKAKRIPQREAALFYGKLEELEDAPRRQALELLAATTDGNPESPFTLEAKLAEWVPETAEYGDWFAAFFDELRVCAGIMLEEPESGAEDAGNGAGQS